MALNIKPTRSELIKLNKQIKLAKSGHSLLKKKRDGLIMEFFSILKNAKSVRGQLAQRYKDAQQRINIARTLYSDLLLRSLAFALQEAASIELQAKNIMGVKVPQISQATVQVIPKQPGFAATTAIIDDAIVGYQKLLQDLLRVAEIETTMKRLLTEIEKTKRRVNALGFRVIPKME